MRRRTFIRLLGGAAAAWPLAARSQQSAMPVIGVISAEWPDLFTDRLRAFHDGLHETGYVEGRNVAIEYRWAEGRNDRLAALAAELVRRQVAAIVAAGSTPAALVARAATTTILIVFYIGADPVKEGLVTSLSRPEGNVTGVVTLNVEVAAKRLELLHELVPTATIVALLVNPTNPTLAETITRDLEVAARTLGLQLHVLHASSERQIDTAFTTLVKLRAGAPVIGADADVLAAGERAVPAGPEEGAAAVRSERRFPRPLRRIRSMHGDAGPPPDGWTRVGGPAQRIRRAPPASRARAAALHGGASGSRGVVRGGNGEVFE